MCCSVAAFAQPMPQDAFTTLSASGSRKPYCAQLGRPVHVLSGECAARRCAVCPPKLPAIIGDVAFCGAPSAAPDARPCRMCLLPRDRLPSLTFMHDSRRGRAATLPGQAESTALTPRQGAQTIVRQTRSRCLPLHAEHAEAASAVDRPGTYRASNEQCMVASIALPSDGPIPAPAGLSCVVERQEQQLRNARAARQAARGLHSPAQRLGGRPPARGIVPAKPRCRRPALRQNIRLR